MKYHFRVHKDDTGYWAECVEIDDCQTQGETPQELLGIPHLTRYQRIERGKSLNLNILARVLQVFQEVSVDKALQI